MTSLYSHDVLVVINWRLENSLITYWNKVNLEQPVHPSSLIKVSAIPLEEEDNVQAEDVDSDHTKYHPRSVYMSTQSYQRFESSS